MLLKLVPPRYDWIEQSFTTVSLWRLEYMLTYIYLDLFLGKFGRDKVGHTFLAEACRISQVLGLFDTEPSYTSQAPRFVPQEKWDTVRAATAWSLFNFQL